MQKGFNLVEIILALAVVTLVFIAVFNFMTTAYVRSAQTKGVEVYFSYLYGEPYCELSGKVGGVHMQNISLASYISTSTRVTSVHVLGGDKFLLTADSSSISESDIFIFNISTTTGTITVVSSSDIGPGIQDSKLLGNFLYVANTSTNSHVKSLRLDMQATGTLMFKELSNIRISSLSSGVSNPKKLSTYNKHLILGSEKSNTGPEVFVMPIESDGAVRTITQTFELDGQLNQSLSAYENLYIANAADPELRLVDKSWQEFFSYDAPLTLGNGKSILYMYPYVILGRTLGSSELSLLQKNGTTTEVFDTKRTTGTVDFLQSLNKNTLLSITANETKELQFWHIQPPPLGPSLILDRSIDTLGRVTAYTCDQNTLYLFMTSNNQTYLTWLNL